VEARHLDFRRAPDHSARAMASAIAYDHPVVVTGGAGFLGTEALRQLREAGCKDIRVVDLNPVPGGDIEGVRSFVADIRMDDLTRAFAGAKTVLHLAACQYHTPLAKSTYDLPFFEVNVDGTGRVVEAAKKAGAARLVFVSTNMVYGLPQALPVRETHIKNPFGPYGQSKIKGEALVAAAHGKGLETAIVRPGLIVGPGRIGVVARVFDWILKGRPIWLIGNGGNRYEVMSSEDVASLVLAAGSESRSAHEHTAFNCAAKSVPTMREWIEKVIEVEGSRSRIIGLPGKPLKAAFRALESARLSPLRKDQYLIADIDYYLDATLAKETLGWTPKWGGLEAILETFRWYKSGGAAIAHAKPNAGGSNARSRPADGPSV
jgi:dTDP-glucose 4,6-dehydratase